jgi:hypothetical protein
MPDAGKSQRLGARLPQEKPRPGFGPCADEVTFPRLMEAESAKAARPKEWPWPLETTQRRRHRCTTSSAVRQGNIRSTIEARDECLTIIDL